MIPVFLVGALAVLPELPTMEQFRAELKEAPAPAVVMPAANVEYRLPPRFSVYGRFFALTNTFDVYDPANAKLGTVTEHFFALTKTFTFTDSSRRKVAEARARFWALGSTVDVVDGEGRKLGTIKEDILRSFLKVYTAYTILDGEGRKIAVSEKKEWLSTEIVLKDASGRLLGEVRRDFAANFFRLTDKWDVTVHDASVVDPRLMAVIASYKSAVDNDRRGESAGSSEQE